jgi:hypothetical protein
MSSHSIALLLNVLEFMPHLQHGPRERIDVFDKVFAHRNFPLDGVSSADRGSCPGATMASAQALAVRYRPRLRRNVQDSLGFVLSHQSTLINKSNLTPFKRRTPNAERFALCQFLCIFALPLRRPRF